MILAIQCVWDTITNRKNKHYQSEESMKKVFLIFGLTILLSTALIAVAITGDTAEDPVCGMEVEIEKAAAKIEGSKDTIYFCSEACKEKFLASPCDYLDQETLDKMGVTLTSGQKAPCSGESASKSLSAPAKEASSDRECGGCARASTTDEADAADQLGCDGNCGNTRVAAINEFHEIMHPMEAAIGSQDLPAIKTLYPQLALKKEAIMNADCPDGACSHRFDGARKNLSDKVDALVTACESEDYGAIKEAFFEMHDAYTALDHAAR